MTAPVASHCCWSPTVEAGVAVAALNWALNESLVAVDATAVAAAVVVVDSDFGLPIENFPNLSIVEWT